MNKKRYYKSLGSIVLSLLDYGYGIECLPTDETGTARASSHTPHLIHQAISLVP